MNILEYIDSLMNTGMSEEEAYICADVQYNLYWGIGDEHELYEDEYTFVDGEAW